VSTFFLAVLNNKYSALNFPASDLDIVISEVIIDPRTPRSVRFDRLDGPTCATARSPKYWIYRASFSDGSTIDPYNAQYAFSTTQDRKRGVFPWKSYLDRLLVPNDASLDILGLTFHRPKGTDDPSGTFREGRANFFHMGDDVRSTAESIAWSTLFVAATILGSPEDLPLAKLMDRSSDRQVHAGYVTIYQTELQDILTQRRAKGIKSTLMQRLKSRLEFSEGWTGTVYCCKTR
jgi:hypothetical protein